MFLKTERLTIRNIQENDWESLRTIWESFNASGFAQYDRPSSTEDECVRQRIAKWAELNEGMDHMYFAVCIQDDVIGYVSFNKRESDYEIGYCFHNRVHGKGYAKESLLALFDYLGGLGIRDFTVGTALNNTPSVSLLKSLGFHLTGTEKVSFYKDMEGHDIIFDGGIFQLQTDSKIGMTW